MGGGTEWKQPPVVRIMHPDGGSTDVFVHAISKASPVVRSMLDPPKKKLEMNITQEGLEVVGEWLLRGMLDKRCTQASSMADLHRLCKAHEAGDFLELESSFLDKVLNCIVDCLSEADYLKISDIQHITHALMKIFKEGSGGWYFLCDWLMMGSMARAEHEVGFGKAITRLIQRASGDIYPLSHCRRLREQNECLHEELPWVNRRWQYYLQEPEWWCEGQSTTQMPGCPSSEHGEMSDDAEMGKNFEESENGEDSEESDNSNEWEDSQDGEDGVLSGR
ncbi:hypothetical protein LTR10_004269 [Elasticomyces elasticus]|nr:hypothetical protein LTR10_004269 [Elasticomyces elasticus]KAK4977551.1 hypothetical protein LTR42_001921 [Elasticomyces elasticus]